MCKCVLIFESDAALSERMLDFFVLILCRLVPLSHDKPSVL